MAENLIEFNDDNFESDVLQSDDLVLVDFWAEWCQPCLLLTPVIEELATQFEGRVKIGKLDTATNRQTAISQDIGGLPTVKIFKDGEVVETIMGAASFEKYVNALEKHLG